MTSQLSRIGFLTLVVTSCLGSPPVAAQEPPPPAEERNKPNVLLIFTDDHRYTGVHSNGGRQVLTPNIDRLKQDGVSFSNAYLMGSFSGATCMPSRATLLTGKHLFQLQDLGRVLPNQHKTIGETFRAAGYRTHIVGKWHQDRASLARSFDSGSSLMGLGVYLTDHFRMPVWDWDPSGAFPKSDAYLVTYSAKGEVARRPLEKTDVRGPLGSERDGPHSSEIFAENAVDFIQSYSDDKPFFLYLAFHAPHDPRHAPARYKAAYPEPEIELPPSYMAEHPFDNGHMVLRDEELAPRPRTAEIVRKHLSDYYAVITHLDDQIGRVIQSLRESGQYRNTIIVLAGDSGLAVGNHGLMGKQNLYDEDGIHVPFIISGGRVQGEGRELDALCYLHDIYPTISDLAGVEHPSSLAGRSLSPVIDGKVDHVRNYTYHAYMQYQRAYRRGDYKLIEYVRAAGKDRVYGDAVRGSRVSQLFNYKQDPWETRNLAYLPEYQELLTAMRAQMRRTAIELGDNKINVGYGFDFWDHYQ